MRCGGKELDSNPAVVFLAVGGALSRRLCTASTRLSERRVEVPDGWGLGLGRFWWGILAALEFGKDLGPVTQIR